MTFNPKGEISISQAIADIRANPGQPFQLVFLRASGKDKGDFKTVAKCLYGRAPQRGQRHTPPIPTRKTALHIEHGTLPCTDYDTDEYLTPLISHIVMYNLHRVKH